MIELNLLPDIKLQYIKAQRTRNLVITVSFLLSAVAVGLLVMMLAASALQKKNLSDIQGDIDKANRTLQDVDDLGKILTVQNQLNQLTDLHSAKPAVKRIPEYLNQLTPPQVSITNFTAKFDEQTISITGKAESLANVNQYIDTLKFTKFKTAKDPKNIKDSELPYAFSNVVMSDFKLSSESNPPATYTIIFSYDPLLFDITHKITFKIPKQITTRSQVDRPVDLFQAAPPPTEEEKQQLTAPQTSGTNRQGEDN